MLRGKIFQGFPEPEDSPPVPLCFMMRRFYTAIAAAILLFAWHPPCSAVPQDLTAVCEDALADYDGRNKSAWFAVFPRSLYWHRLIALTPVEHFPRGKSLAGVRQSAIYKDLSGESLCLKLTVAEEPAMAPQEPYTVIQAFGRRCFFIQGEVTPVGKQCELRIPLGTQWSMKVEMQGAAAPGGKVHSTEEVMRGLESGIDIDHIQSVVTTAPARQTTTLTRESIDRIPIGTSPAFIATWLGKPANGVDESSGRRSYTGAYKLNDGSLAVLHFGNLPARITPAATTGGNKRRFERKAPGSWPNIFPSLRPSYMQTFEPPIIDGDNWSQSVVNTFVGGGSDHFRITLGKGRPPELPLSAKLEKLIDLGADRFCRIERLAGDTHPGVMNHILSHVQRYAAELDQRPRSGKTATPEMFKEITPEMDKNQIESWVGKPDKTAVKRGQRENFYYLDNSTIAILSWGLISKEVVPKDKAASRMRELTGQ